MQPNMNPDDVVNFKHHPPDHVVDMVPAHDSGIPMVEDMVLKEGTDQALVEN